MVGANEKNGIFYAFDAIQLENGPVWSFQVGVPGELGTLGSCLAAAVWDVTHEQLIRRIKQDDNTICELRRFNALVSPGHRRRRLGNRIAGWTSHGKSNVEW